MELIAEMYETSGSDAMAKVFQKKYGMLPSEYRKKKLYYHKNFVEKRENSFKNDRKVLYCIGKAGSRLKISLSAVENQDKIRK